jgi:hypothetical protein
MRKFAESHPLRDSIFFEGAISLLGVALAAGWKQIAGIIRAAASARLHVVDVHLLHRRPQPLKRKQIIWKEMAAAVVAATVRAIPSELSAFVRIRVITAPVDYGQNGN